MLFIFGIIGLISVVSGYTCQTVGNEQVSREQMRIIVENEVAKAKSQLKKELTGQFAEKQAMATSTYSEDSFVKLTMLYPMNWGVEHETNSLTFRSIDKNSWFSIFKQVETYNGVPNKDITEGTWMNYKTKKTARFSLCLSRQAA